MKSINQTCVQNLQTIFPSFDENSSIGRLVGSRSVFRSTDPNADCSAELDLNAQVFKSKTNEDGYGTGVDVCIYGIHLGFEKLEPANTVTEAVSKARKVLANKDIPSHVVMIEWNADPHTGRHEKLVIYRLTQQQEYDLINAIRAK